ncbi:hypothetical protein, partial [Campylobacter concisus]|uniref:hypothetical protein n=1 Tax=Campylobacter concisus TaxID=199 RepID=UPI001CA4979D
MLKFYSLSLKALRPRQSPKDQAGSARHIKAPWMSNAISSERRSYWRLRACGGSFALATRHT